MKPSLLLLTCANQAEADKIARALLEKHLVVCVKKTPVNSDFLWQGKIDHGSEILLIMDSHEELFDQVEQEIKKLHSYDLPVLVSLPVSKTTVGVAKWMKQELRR
ncbi:divalent-cation tolerance protein CutA [Patescibacteria group bacterium]|nr:divalent-cation tolerance protein CutA [Patescibacteria group bacterium]